MQVMSMISLSHRRLCHCLTPTHTYAQGAEAASSWERCDASHDWSLEQISGLLRRLCYYIVVHCSRHVAMIWMIG
jgi:hypothetical protein